MGMTRVIPAALLLLQGALPGVGQASPLDGMISSLVRRLGGSCSPVSSWSVQVRGRPMCMESKDASQAIEHGRDQRLAAVKAIGMTIAMLTDQGNRQNAQNATADRANGYLRHLESRVGAPVVVAGADMQRYTDRTPRTRTQFALSVSARMFVGLPEATGFAPNEVNDPVEAALIARSATTGAELNRSLRQVEEQIYAREQLLAGGGVTAAEARRIDAELASMRAYVAGARGVARSQHTQLKAYRAIEDEKHWLLKQLDNSGWHGHLAW